jgi:hypothetical protein
VEAQRLDGATVVDSGCARKCSGERGPSAVGRERAHRRVSRVADGKAKLTVALDGAQAQRRLRNRRWASAGGGGALALHGQSEREGRGSWAEGTNERGEVGEQGAGVKRGAGARTWPENARSWAHPRRGIVSERLQTTDRWGRQDRKRGSGCAREN